MRLSEVIPRGGPLVCRPEGQLRGRAELASCCDQGRRKLARQTYSSRVSQRGEPITARCIFLKSTEKEIPMKRVILAATDGGFLRPGACTAGRRPTGRGLKADNRRRPSRQTHRARLSPTRQRNYHGTERSMVLLRRIIRSPRRPSRKACPVRLGRAPWRS